MKIKILLACLFFTVLSCTTKDTITYLDTEVINGKVSNIDIEIVHYKLNEDTIYSVYIQDSKVSRKVEFKNSLEAKKFKVGDPILLVIDTYREIK